MRMCSIASGSSGNCIYVGTEATHLLVDVGISCKKTVEGLNKLGLAGNDIDGILITHEHSDHVNGLGVMSRKFGIPIYATAGTIEGIKKIGSLGKIMIYVEFCFAAPISQPLADSFPTGEAKRPSQ